MARSMLRGSFTKHMKRYKDESFDLDLTYLRPNLIVMCYPAETAIESMLRNPMESVVRFLDERHKNQYKVYNLCKEKKYPSIKFHHRVALYPVAKDRPPAPELIKAFCEDVTNWLGQKEEHVAVVHAVGNKVRTCMMVSCFLLHQHVFKKAEDAIKFYANATTPGDVSFSLKQPSHGRFVRYYEGLVSRKDLEYKHHPLLLTKVQIDTVPRIANDTCTPSFALFRDDVKIHKSGIKVGVKTSHASIILGENLMVPVCGNLKFEFYHRVLTLNTKSLMFKAWVNSFFIAKLIGDDAQWVEDDSDQIKGNRVIRITLKKSELDKAHLDQTNKFFSPNLKVHLYFAEMSDLTTPLPPPGPCIPDNPFRVMSQFVDDTNLIDDASDNSGDEEDLFPEEGGKDHTPIEILARGSDALHAYRDAIESGKKAVYRTRVMFVGQERVGKTSLKRRIMGEKFDAHEISTDGIETSSHCRIDVQQTMSWTADHMTKDQHGSYTSAIAEHMARQLKEKLNISQLDEQPDGELLSSQEIRISDATSIERRHSVEAIQCTSDINDEKTMVEIAQEPEQVKLDTPEEDSDFDEEFRQSASDSFDQSELSPDPESKLLSQVPDHVSNALADKLGDETEDQNDQGITFSIWDFAGQELYYTTHQVFLCRRTVFVVVVKLTDDFTQTRTEKAIPTALDRLDFWLQSIHTFTVDEFTHSKQDQNREQLSPPIFIVGTHRNSLGDTEDERQKQVKSKFECIHQSFQGKRYREHIVTEYFDVENSLDGDDRICDLQRKMMEVMEREPYMGEEIPLRWLQFEDSVKEVVKNGQNTMTIDEVRQLPGASDVYSTTELTTMLQFYHDLGTIMYHPTAKSSLRELVILNPHWLIDVFRRVITVLDRRKQRAVDLSSWERLDKEGILEDKLINVMWQEFIGNDAPSGQGDKKPAMLELMGMYDLLVEQCPPNEEQQQATRCYYVPSRLKETDDDTGDESNDESPNTVVFYADFNGFLPVGFFHRIMARAVHWSQKQGGLLPRLLYRKATFYADDFHNFQIEMMANTPSIVKVTICPEEVVGDKAASKDDVDPAVCHKVKNFLADTFEDLRSTWACGITYRFCLECPCKTGTLHFLNLDECLTGKTQILKCMKRRSVSTKSFIHWFSNLSGQGGSEVSDTASNIPQGQEKINVQGDHNIIVTGHNVTVNVTRSEQHDEHKNDKAAEEINFLKKFNLPSFLAGVQESYKNIPEPSIPFDIFTKLCTMLTPKHVFGHDWRMLASKMGLDSYIEYLNQLEEPTAVVLRHWMEKGDDVDDLCELLKSISRMDVADALSGAVSR